MCRRGINSSKCDQGLELVRCGGRAMWWGVDLEKCICVVMNLFVCCDEDCYEEVCYEEVCYEEVCYEEVCYEEVCYEEVCYEEVCYEEVCYV
jgi:hypothetical protein